MSILTLRRRLIERLDPLDGWSAERSPTRSDFDLNPTAERRPPDGLRPAAVLIPIVASPGGAQVILTRRADALASHSGQIAFPGGRLDAGETAVGAALREAHEEIGLDPDAVELLGLGDAYETGTGFLVTPVVGWIAAPQTLTPRPEEVADIFETPWDFLMDVGNHRRDFYDREGQERRWYWAMPWGERYIWGVTAGILRALRDRLYGDEDQAAATEDAA